MFNACTLIIVRSGFGDIVMSRCDTSQKYSRIVIEGGWGET